MTNEKSLERLIECANIHRSLHDHPNITKIAGIQFLSDQSQFCLFLEKAEGSVRDIINPESDKHRDLRDRVFAKKSPRDVIKEALDALACVHSQTDRHDNKISHRDFKPENLLIFPQERDDSHVIKISDFDSSKSMEDDKRVSMTTGVITEKYQDPWLAMMKERGLKVGGDNYLYHNTYGFGLFFFEMLDGTHLFTGSSNLETLLNMRYNKRDHLINSQIDELAKNAIWTTTQPEPAERITLEQVKKLPYFSDKSDHIQALCELNEAIVNMGKSVEVLKLLEELNKTFFMIFEKRWKDLPFVVPDLLKTSKYSNSLASFLMFKRNFIMHAGQNQEVLKKHFGKVLCGEDLLDIVTDYQPCAMMHVYWVAKKFFPHLSCTKNLPNQCVKAHEDRMMHERRRLKISEDSALEKMQKEVCPDDLTTTPSTPIPTTVPTIHTTAVPKGHQVTIENFLKNFQEQVQDIIKNTEPAFKVLVTDVESWEAKKGRLLRAIQYLTKNHSSESEIEKKKAELTEIEEKLEVRWILDYREGICDPSQYKAGKIRFFSDVSKCKMSFIRDCKD